MSANVETLAQAASFGSRRGGGLLGPGGSIAVDGVSGAARRRNKIYDGSAGEILGGNNSFARCCSTQLDRVAVGLISKKTL